MPSTDRKLEFQAKDIDVSTISQPAVCLGGLTWRGGQVPPRDVEPVEDKEAVSW